jgi:rhodanese-related sulfurtransferase
MKALWKWLGLAGLVAGGMACAARAGGYKNITTEEAAALLKKPGTFLLDVRTQQEYAAGRLAGATLAPVQVLEAQLGKLPADKETPILIYCRTGNRSGAAGGILAKHGYKNLYNMKGGILAWSAEGRPVETGDNR